MGGLDVQELNEWLAERVSAHQRLMRSAETGEEACIEEGMIQMCGSVYVGE